MAYQGTKINPKKNSLSHIKFYLILLPFVICAVFPLIFIFSQAFKPLDELFLFPPRFLVQHPTLDNFKMLMSVSDQSAVPMSRYLLNSVSVTAIVMTFSVLFSSMAGYILSKHKFTGQKFVFEANQIALMFIPIAVTIPRYLVVAKLGLIDSYWSAVLPLIAVPVGLFLLKQFIDQIPDEVIEGAKMDGASSFTIYRKIIVPLTIPAMATVAILSFQTVWNSVEASTLYINDESLKTFAYYMSTLSTTTGANVVAGQGISAASSLIMFLPNLIIFIILQNKVMDTVSSAGME